MRRRHTSDSDYAAGSPGQLSAIAVSVVAFLAMSACAVSFNDWPQGNGAGGATGGHGSVQGGSNGGTSNGLTGGATALSTVAGANSGGQPATTTGGNTGGATTSTGGTSANAGATSTGGALNTGGTHTAGATSTTGGRINASGGSSNGAATSSGGASAIGGVTSAGGMPSTGGTPAGGGTSTFGGSSGTGGLANTGGAAPATGGTSGSGGNSACGASCTDPNGIDDFEDGDVIGCPRNNWVSSWWLANDGAGTLTYPASVTDKAGLQVQLSPPRGTSCRGLHMSGSGFYGWGANLGYTFNNPDETVPRAVDLSGFTGVSFWLRGSGNVRFLVGTTDTEPPANGGTCAVACKQHFTTANFAIPSTWTNFQESFSILSSATVNRYWTGSDRGKVLFIALQTPLSAAFDLWVDDVTLLP